MSIKNLNYIYVKHQLYHILYIYKDSKVDHIKVDILKTVMFYLFLIILLYNNLKIKLYLFYQIKEQDLIKNTYLFDIYILQFTLNYLLFIFYYHLLINKEI